jgi:hypothetical protein
MEQRPRIRPFELSELDEELQEMAEKWREQGGDDHFIRTFAHAPEFLKRFIAFYSPLVRKGRVEHRTKELVRLRLASLNECHY